MYHQLLQTASAHYGLTFSDAEVLHKTSRTLVLAVKSEQGEYVLKSIFTPESRLLFILDAELYLRERGIEIPEIRLSLTGEPYFLWEGDRFVLQEKLTGIPSPPATEEAVTRRAALLGRMHAASLGFLSKHGPNYPQERVWISTWLRELFSIQRWADEHRRSKASKKSSILSYIDFYQETGREAFERLGRHAYFRSWSRAPLQEHYLCHGDFHSDNVLTVGPKLYIIDWEFIRYDYPSKDIRRFLHGITNRRKAWDPVWFQLLLDAYLKENSLTEGQLEIMFLDLSFPHRFYRFLEKGEYRNMSMDEVNAFLQREYEQTSYMLQHCRG